MDEDKAFELLALYLERSERDCVWCWMVLGLLRVLEAWSLGNVWLSCDSLRRTYILVLSP